MTTESVKTIASTKINHTVRGATTAKSRESAEKAMQLAYFLTIIETMLCEGTPQQVSRKDVAEFVSLAREKADALCLELKQ